MGGFARRINVGDNNAIGVDRRRAKFLSQRLGSRVAMRLKHCQHAFAPGRSRGREGGPDFGRMMRVIIHQQKPVAGIFDFETAARVLEICASDSGNFLKRNSELGCERDDAERRC